MRKCDRSDSDRIYVLIDTWWNVNTTNVRKATPGDACFNRYMVECEL